MDRKQKTIFQLDTPYTEVHWPQISSKDLENIYELLIRFLAPIGRHRKMYRVPSKGKRNRKRKRIEAKYKSSNLGHEQSDPSPPRPELSSHLLIGLASITRQLELLARTRRVIGSHEKSGKSLLRTSSESEVDLEWSSKTKVSHLAAIFLCRSSQPPVLRAHLPQLAVTASLAHPHLQPTRLVVLPQDCEFGLSSSLGLPRAPFFGILEDAPHSKPLMDLVREVVPVIEATWLKEAQKAEYLPVKVNAVLTTIPPPEYNQKQS